MGAVREEVAAAQPVLCPKPSENPEPKKGEEELRLFHETHMELHRLSQEAPANVGKDVIAKSAGDHRAPRPDPHRASDVALVPPEQRGGRDGAQTDVQGMEQMEGGAGLDEKLLH